jgi:hypothetical protein
LAGLVGLSLVGLAAAQGARGDATEAVDTGLILAVDVSGSVTPERFLLQMDGIAAAFEDPSVQATILAGPHHALAIVLVQWSDKARVSVPWTVLASRSDALAFAARVRAAPRIADQFTCVSQMMRFVADKVVTRLPAHAERLVLDVSGDGAENCNPLVPVESVRDELVAGAVTINGLPILAENDAEQLGPWYASHVVGGPGGFLVPARGFDDFARAMRQKFLTEISAIATERGSRQVTSE